MPSALSEELIGKYLTAQYQIRMDTSAITLQIGRRSAPLAALLRATANQNAVYITACNPASKLISPEENQSAMVRLYEKVTCYSNHIYCGKSIDPSGEWPAEESLLVLGIDLSTARSIGQEFGQNAIVWIDSAAIPHLILLY